MIYKLFIVFFLSISAYCIFGCHKEGFIPLQLVFIIDGLLDTINVKGSNFFNDVFILF
jgi:hypothetical protein